MKTIILSLFVLTVNAQNIAPVSPNASPEATALLNYIQDISGKHILSGQHNFPISGERNSQFAADYIGKTPVVWSQDFGFSEDGDKDSYLARPAIIEEAIRQHEKGAIVTLCWHAVPPTAIEPITFQPLPDFDSTALASVQGNLLPQQFEDILTPGTDLYEKWTVQVDDIASHLKKLQEANVPVLWRPYHEMNGDWFWWGGIHEGEFTTAALYKQIFDRLVHHHKLNNLVWVWSVDRPSSPGREFIKFYPGNDYLDILAIDIYGNDYNKDYYDGLMELSQGKPLALGEVGNPPAVEIIEEQPNWTFWVVWSGMVRGTSKDDYHALVENSRALFFEDSAFVEGTSELRKASGFDKIIIDVSADFTGDWFLNETESVVEGNGPGGGTPYKMDVSQTGDIIGVRTFTQSEWDDDQVSAQSLMTDGSEIHSTVFNNSPRIQHANWSEDKSTLIIDSKITFNFGGREMEVTSEDTWSSSQRGKRLQIIRKSKSPFGGGRESTSLLIYDKR